MKSTLFIIAVMLVFVAGCTTAHPYCRSVIYEVYDENNKKISEIYAMETTDGQEHILEEVAYFDKQQNKIAIEDSELQKLKLDSPGFETMEKDGFKVIKKRRIR